MTPEQYASEVRRWRDQVGRMQWAAIQDWMCEPFITEKTGLSVREHQHRTVESYHILSDLAPDAHWMPVIQGWEYDDYFRCVELYALAGVNLAAAPVVGLGSVCRRQATRLAEDVIRDLRAMGIRLHAFGFKLGGLKRAAHMRLAPTVTATPRDGISGLLQRSENQTRVWSCTRDSEGAIGCLTSRMPDAVVPASPPCSESRVAVQVLDPAPAGLHRVL